MTADEFLDIAFARAGMSRIEPSYLQRLQVSRLVIRARISAGLTQRQLADRMGVTPAYVSQLESGTANPSVLALTKALRAAGFSLEMDIKSLAETAGSTGVDAASLLS
jgi:transcriptional regulator with XRE-family HTH domain